MCGIAGYIGYGNARELCMQANEIQRHRGPDSQEVWSNGLVGFAHQRLSILDLSDAGNQPFIKRNYVIVFNGEVYNFKELKSSFLESVNFKSQTDTEVVLEMFALLGPECLQYFRGMFSFVIWNTETEEAFLARDHFGIKPLFYSFQDNKLSFASELKTLLGTVVKNPSINMSSMVKAVNYTWLPGNDSIIMEAKKLPPGNYATFSINTGDLTLVKYHTLHVADNYISTEDLLAEITGSVNAHLISDVPVSAFLSGGLDSSLISKIAKDRLGELVTYTIGRNDVDSSVERMSRDEDYARLLVNKEGFDHNEFVLGSDIMRFLPKMVYHLDEPIGDPAAINTYLMCFHARENGSKVILSGMGADELFFGYRRHKAFMIAQKYRALPSFIRKIIWNVVTLLPVKIGGRGLRLIRWSKKFLSIAEQSNSESYRMSYSYYSEEDLKKLFLKNVDEEITEVKTEHEKVFNSVSGSVQNRICNTDVHFFMQGLNLTYTDRSSMAASVEVRVPFVDKSVIETAMTSDGNQKFTDGTLKYTLKKAAESILPKNIIHRPKASFGAPIRSWISKDLVDTIDDILSLESIKKRGIFNPNYVRGMIEADRAGQADYAYQIYQLLSIEIWFRIFIDRDSSYDNIFLISPE